MPSNFPNTNGFQPDAWLFEPGVSDMLNQSSPFDDTFGIAAASPAASGSLMAPYTSFPPGDYLFDPSIAHSPDAAAANVAMPSPELQADRFHCQRPGCSNNNGEGFQRPSDLKRHQEKHEKRHKCSDCTRQFGSKADLERHGREVHGKGVENGKPAMHFCPDKNCKRNKRGFPRLWNMQQHYSKMHHRPAPSPFSSPQTDTMDTPLISSGESAPNTPPSSMDEPHTPCRAISGDANDHVLVRGLIASRLKQIEAQRQEIEAQRRESDAEATRLRLILQSMNLERNDSNS